MKTLSKPAFLFVALSILIGVSVVRAQNDPQAAIAKKQAQLERQRIELEKKSLELQQKELDLEKARQEFEAQQSGRSLSMNLSGDVLFDYDKAALKPEAEQALKKVAVVLSQFPESKVTVEGYTDSKRNEGDKHATFARPCAGSERLAGQERWRLSRECLDERIRRTISNRAEQKHRRL